MQKHFSVFTKGLIVDLGVSDVIDCEDIKEQRTSQTIDVLRKIIELNIFPLSDSWLPQVISLPNSPRFDLNLLIRT
jgi:hypothetical protein